jgi:predicted lipid-binding transport protein (Tim44 family)
MADPPGGLGQADNSDPLQSAADRPTRYPQDGGFRGRAERAEEDLFHVRQISADEERLIDLRQQEVDGIVAALSDRAPAELAGVDTTALRQVDPSFDDEAFRAIARETFYKVREARKLQNPQESTELLSPQMQSELQNAISGDVASHRHHLLPFLSVNDAVIAGAQVVGGKEEIDVQFSISAAEEDVDDHTGQVLAGNDAERSWDERWRFTRDPLVDTSVSDEQHEISLIATDAWLVAHRGWLVTHITRLPAT